MEWIPSNLSELFTVIISAIALIIFLIALIKNGLSVFNIFNRLNKIDLDSLDRIIKTSNVFTQRILPRVLQGLETKEVVEKGTLVEWTEIMSKKFAPAHSPTRINEDGEKLIDETGIKKIIDEKLDIFIKELESQNLKSPYDVEQNCFYLLKSKKNTDVMIPIRNYVYCHPNGFAEEIIFFVGGVYLRDKYFEKYPEILKNI